MTGQEPPVITNKNTSISRKESRGEIEEEEQPNSSGGMRSIIAIQTPWTKDALELARHLRTKKNDKGSKADFVSTAIKRDISLDIAQTKEQGRQKHLCLTLQLLPSKLKDQSVQLKRRKLSLPPSTQNQKKSVTASLMNYLAKRIFSTPKPGSLGKGTLN